MEALAALLVASIHGTFAVEIILVIVTTDVTLLLIRVVFVFDLDDLADDARSPNYTF